MTIYFAAALNRAYSAIANALSPTIRLSPTNDNTTDRYGDPAIITARELFAMHDIAATVETCRKARSAANAANAGTRCRLAGYSTASLPTVGSPGLPLRFARDGG